MVRVTVISRREMRCAWRVSRVGYANIGCLYAWRDQQAAESRGMGALALLDPARSGLKQVEPETAKRRQETYAA